MECVTYYAGEPFVRNVDYRKGFFDYFMGGFPFLPELRKVSSELLLRGIPGSQLSKLERK